MVSDDSIVDGKCEHTGDGSVLCSVNASASQVPPSWQLCQMIASHGCSENDILDSMRTVNLT